MSAVLLAACGGETITGSSTTGPVGSTVSSITVGTSATQIATDGSSTATITAVAKDANNNLVSGAAITFAASAGGLAVTQATTDVNGAAIATLSGAGLAAGTAITVTAAAGTVTGSATVTVIDIKQTVSLTTSLPQIPSDGSKSAIITALVRDATNNFIPGVAVTFQSTSGGLAVTQATTDVNGAATATLTAANDPTNRVITVTATAATGSATIPVAVVGTGLSVVGPPNLVLGSQGTYTVALTNSSGTGIPNVSIALSSSLGNALSTATVTTDATGQKTFTMTATKAGSDTIAASALGLTASQLTAISAQSFAFITPPADGTVAQVNLGTAQDLIVQWTSNGVAQVGQTVTFASTRGTLSAGSAVTDAAGKAKVTVSSTVAGPATVTASSTGVTTQASLNFVATVAASIDVQPSPATIPTQGQSTITAVVRDAANNLVQGQTVTFKTVGDITGGSLSVASAITDAQGRAQTVYVASTTPSATNGIEIDATVQGTAVTSSARLTVGGLTVFLSLGTGNQLGENAAKTLFSIPYVVVAVDAAGNPVANVPISLTVQPLTYYKGGWLVNGSAWQQTGTPDVPSFTPITACPNEDANFNGVLDPGEDGLASDAGLPTFNASGNQNGRLDPGGTAVTSPSQVTTAADGTANFAVIYPENQAQWDTVKLIASATVQGTETTASATFKLPILAIYVTTTTSSPPGVRSPYGTATTCTDPN